MPEQSAQWDEWDAEAITDALRQTGWAAWHRPGVLVKAACCRRYRLRDQTRPTSRGNVCNPDHGCGGPQ